MFVVCKLLGVGLMAAMTATSAVAEERSSPRPAIAVSTGILAELDRATVELFKRVAPSVVQVATLGKPGTNRSLVSTASGFFWDPTGHIVTNSHVLQDAAAIAVSLASGEQFEGELVGTASIFDLAVIRLKGFRRAVTPIGRGASDVLKVGQWVFTIGHPFGLEQSMTAGVVSGLRRELPTIHGRTVRDIIQSDAAVYPGSSGSALVDTSGRLIGVNTITYSTPDFGAAFGFALPVELVSRIVPQLIKSGRIPIPGIGIIPQEEPAAGRPTTDGVTIAEILPESPAQRAFLRPNDAAKDQLGDTIVAANGHVVRDIYDLTQQFDEVGIGRTIRITVYRNGQALELNVDVVDIDDINSPRSDKVAALR